MSTGPGRPRKACSTCKSQKIRCTGERPICKRCMRLRHPCIYNSSRAASSSHSDPRPQQDSSPASTHRRLTPTRPAPQEERHIPGHESIRIVNNVPSPPVISCDALLKGGYLGIPHSLASTLIDVYFDHVYNAHLLLHKRSFLESLVAGTVRPHVLLGVCAWAANFYRDQNGHATLKDHGFMIEWAKQAGKLVLQEAEDLHEDNIVTFSNLALFWHSQGSWRISILHKGNACHLLHILGYGSTTLSTENSLDSEMRLRRLWACYLMNCHVSDSVLFFSAITDMMSYPLPWPCEDFDAGFSKALRVSMNSSQSNGGIFSEIIKILTLWDSVVSLIKSPESNISERVMNIHSLDERISDWWQKLRSDFKLTPANITAIPGDILPKILLINIVYHQSLCALHASIVPLFSWGPGDDSRSSARQLSAQVAFEHAGSASELLDSVLSKFTMLSRMPGFLAYAAYCGCAIQVPFIWCSNAIVKERALRNFRANVKMIDTLSNYFSYAKLLQVHARCLYNIYRDDPPILEDEPRFIDIAKLSSCKLNGTSARASILQYSGIIRTKMDGYVKPGEEREPLAAEDDRSEKEPQPTPSMRVAHALPSPLDSNPSQSSPHSLSEPAYSYPSLVMPPFVQQESYQQGQHHHHQQQQSELTSLPTQNLDSLAVENPAVGVFSPFADPQHHYTLPAGEMLDFSQFDINQQSLDYF